MYRGLDSGGLLHLAKAQVKRLSRRQLDFQRNFDTLTTRSKDFPTELL